jgi:hypothetical protein
MQYLNPNAEPKKGKERERYGERRERGKRET